LIPLELQASISIVIQGVKREERMPKLILAVSAVALFAGSAMAQTINNAPQNSPVGVQDQVKQAPQVGDPSQVGGTPSANTKGAQGQMQDPHKTGTMAPSTKGK
jgi:hypothetical protein